MKRFVFKIILICTFILCSAGFWGAASIAIAEDVPLIQDLPDEKAPLLINNKTSDQTPDTNDSKRIGIGFGVGFNYIINFDSRFSGFGNQFMFQFPLDKGMTLSILYESDKYEGHDNGVTAHLDTSITALRINKEIVRYASVFLGVGTATTSGAFSDNGMLTDFGAKVTPLSSLTPGGKILSTVIAIDIVYRHLSANPGSYQFSATSTPITSLSGFIIGANFTLLF